MGLASCARRGVEGSFLCSPSSRFSGRGGGVESLPRAWRASWGANSETSWVLARAKATRNTAGRRRWGIPVSRNAREGVAPHLPLPCGTPAALRSGPSQCRASSPLSAGCTKPRPPVISSVISPPPRFEVRKIIVAERSTRRLSPSVSVALSKIPSSNCHSAPEAFSISSNSRSSA